MGYGIVATFDEGLRNELLGLMDCFMEQRIGKTPKDFGEPPHLTLALFLDASIDVQALASACEHMRTQKLEVLLHVFGSFVAEEAQAVIYLNPALSTELGALHLGLYEEFDRLGLRDHHEHFRPGQWVPHCTLAVELTQDDYLKAVALCLGLPKKLYRGFITNLKILEFFPVRELYDFALKDTASHAIRLPGSQRT